MSPLISLKFKFHIPLDWYGWDVGLVGQSIFLGQTAIVDSVVGSMLCFEEKSL